MRPLFSVLCTAGVFSPAVHAAAFGDKDASPTKAWIFTHRNDLRQAA